MPESKTPMGRAAFAVPSSAISLIAATDRNRRRMIFRAERFVDRTGVRRQIHFGDGEIRALCPVIDRSVVILDALGDRGAESLPIIARRDPLAFRRIADKAAFNEDRRNL